MVLLFTYVMLAKNTHISFHTEANGCIFFTAGEHIKSFNTLRIYYSIIIEIRAEKTFFEAKLIDFELTKITLKVLLHEKR